MLNYCRVYDSKCTIRSAPECAEQISVSVPIEIVQLVVVKVNGGLFQ